MPSISQSELRRKEYIVVKDKNTEEVLQVIFPNGIQAGIVGFKSNFNSIFYGNAGIKVPTPTAQIHIGPGSTSQGTAPIKFSSGSLLSSPETGAVEYDGTDIFYTTNNLTRRNITAKPYGFYLNTSTTTASPGNELIFSFDTTVFSSYFDLVSSNKFYAGYSATYNIMFTIQFQNTDTANDHDAYVWLKLTGSNVDYTRSDVTVPNKHSGVNGSSIMTVNFFQKINSGSYFQLAWSADSTSVFAATLASAASPTRPASAAVVLTINRID